MQNSLQQSQSASEKVRDMEFQENLGAGSTVQSVERAVQLLGLVMRSETQGARLNDLVEASGLTKPTVHRLLKQLVTSGMLVQGQQRLYQLGPGAFELSIAASRSFPLRDLASPLLEEVAGATGDSVFLIVPSGHDSLCVDRKLGAYPVKVLTIDVGHRQPLGVGAGGLAILSFLDAGEQKRCLERLDQKLAAGAYGGMTARIVRKLVAETSKRGWSQIADYAVPGVTGVGVALLDAQRRPFGSISVGAITLRMTDQKMQESAILLQAIARRLERLLTFKSPGRGP